jgi:hypothetical protein
VSLSIKNLRAAVKESGRDRDLLAFEFNPIPPGINGGCGTRTHVAGTNGGTMPCGALLNGTPYYCGHCDKTRRKI